MDEVLLMLGAGFMLWCLAEGIVRIIKASRTSDPEGSSSDLRGQIEDLEEELLDARKRIEVLESIVTDDRHTLRKQIDELD